MSSRTPRRSFAHPFVVTLAAVPACSGGGGSARPPHQNPPPPQYVEPAGPAPTEPAGPAGPAPTEPAAPAGPAPTAPTEPMEAKPAPGGPAPSRPPDYTSRWLVTKSGATCMAVPRVECPKGEPGKPVPTCNPPPARAYTCPPSMTEPSLTVVRYASSFDCVIEPAAVKCPPNVACNPPPPRKVDCPK